MKERYEVSRTDPIHEEWAARASQEHMVQARIRLTQAAGQLTDGDNTMALTTLITTLDHLIQALAQPEQQHNHQREIAAAREEGFAEGLKTL